MVNPRDRHCADNAAAAVQHAIQVHLPPGLVARHAAALVHCEVIETGEERVVVLPLTAVDDSTLRGMIEEAQDQFGR